MEQPRHKELEQGFEQFASTHVAPHAAQCDREERIPDSIIEQLGDAGYLGIGIPTKWGGGGADSVTFGLLNRQIARASASVHGVINVHHMATAPIARWGSSSMRETWLPRLVRGELVAAFAATEPEVGSDAAAIRTTARPDGDHFVLNGTKKWITLGQRADVFVILARCDEGPTAFLVERDTPGVEITPIRGILGCRGYMLAEIRFDQCRIPGDNIVGRLGLGLTHVFSVGLDIGRYGLAWGCTGVLDACLDASLHHTRRRQQFGVAIREHQLVQQMITRMVTKTRAAELLCTHAGKLRDQRAPSAIAETSLAKYYASVSLGEVAADAVQLHGAAGCSAEQPVQRYMRDAKIMEIIEGTTQIQELAIARYAYQDLDRAEPLSAEADCDKAA
ncbi:MAG: acyl-CoA dehydrogenase family protein [Candidatus Binatia bacterium]|nr:acyl-CoA dehydrogenase family protein [Candidatus Binatia bacterium]